MNTNANDLTTLRQMIAEIQARHERLNSDFSSYSMTSQANPANKDRALLLSIVWPLLKLAQHNQQVFDGADETVRHLSPAALILVEINEAITKAVRDD